MIRLNHPYKCKHCQTAYAILQGYYAWSFIPVEIINGTEQNDPEYDKTKHVSHLLNCKELQAQWNEVKKIIMAESKQKEKVEMISLLK